jgi:hypothetical protein
MGIKSKGDPTLWLAYSDGFVRLAERPRVVVAWDSAFQFHHKTTQGSGGRGLGCKLVFVALDLADR